MRFVSLDSRVELESSAARSDAPVSEVGKQCGPDSVTAEGFVGHQVVDVEDSDTAGVSHDAPASDAHAGVAFERREETKSLRFALSEYLVQ
jgi:hypothetical protein